MNAQDEEWGEEALVACAKTCCSLDARKALDRLMSGAVAFRAAAAQHDDMTLVVLRVCDRNTELPI
jgi:sigma-B regulation protein RsbU (phosphoserine phosphatase)